MKKSKRRQLELFGLSFMDAICCGFGAVILLFVLSEFSELKYVPVPKPPSGPIGSPEPGKVVPDEPPPDPDAELAAELEAEAAKLAQEAMTLAAQVEEARNKLSASLGEEDAAAKALAKAGSVVDEAGTEETVLSKVEGELQQARQKLTDEMRRLLAQANQKPTEVVGGVPVDSEYIVFIIDTSGSMHRQWPLVQRKMQETLAIYPKVKGIQVMNDMGQYMFTQYAGRWIPDTPARRKVIMQMMRSWAPFSNSSPVEGITEAIRRFQNEDHNVSLYIFGDDFRGMGLDYVLLKADQLNRTAGDGKRRVRIHAVGFPNEQHTTTGKGFATLMRALCERNGGTFVGLTER